jgi:GNAT superfamily N-acetyltransferase
MHASSSDAEGPVIIREAPADASTLEAIGRLRYRVWTDEGQIAAARFPGGVWLDRFDASARHWLACDARGRVIGAARMTVHQALADAPDGYVWTDAGRSVPLPFANISKLVVAREARGRGVGLALSEARIAAATEDGIRHFTVTSSAANARLLARLGFWDTGVRVRFPDRPGVEFLAMELGFPGTS